MAASREELCRTCNEPAYYSCEVCSSMRSQPKYFCNNCWHRRWLPDITVVGLPIVRLCADCLCKYVFLRRITALVKV
jgi:hypothetical protein